MPQNESIERKKDEQPNRIKKPQGIGFLLIGSFSIVGAVFLTTIALSFREIEVVPAWISFLTTNVLNLLLLTVVVIQAYIYRKQWQTMDKQWEAMREQRDAMQKQLNAMMYGQRAYITVSGYEIKKGEAMAIAKFELKVENSGNTPASNVEIFDLGEVRQCSPVPDIVPSKWIQLGIIAPSKYAIHIIDVTKEMPKMVNQTYHHQGIVRYKDIFGECHCTKFCLEVSGMAPFRGIPCKEGGNEAN